MSRLKMITREDSNPRDVGGVQIKTLPRVYFAAHPKDHKKYLDIIAEEIFRTHNCAFCFDSQPESPYDDLISADLAQINLFVIPVTSRLLTDPDQSRVFSFDLPFAKEHGIAILPLMQEENLESIYAQNEQLKTRQFLTKHTKDLTALKYEHKLQTFLDGVLLSETRMEQIREAFSARMFLSYRKKNRDLAQKLMETIHKSDRFRDVAIWYDEFLTPGEDFNQDIKKVIAKCDLFALAVTPDLLDKGNYVITHEYPTAIEPPKKMVFSAMVEDTSVPSFQETFPQAEPLVHAWETEALYKALQEAFASERVLGHTLSAKNDPQHEYLIGLAYLNGFEVELDADRAFHLIHGAAEGGCPDAMRELIHMYKTGHTVAQNMAEILHWQKELADWYQCQYEKSGDKAMLQNWIDAQDDIVVTLWQTQEKTNLEQAAAMCNNLAELRNTLCSAEENSESFAEFYETWSMVLFELGPRHYGDAMERLKKSLDLTRESFERGMQNLQEKKRLLERYITCATVCVNYEQNATALTCLQEAKKLCGSQWASPMDADFMRIKANILGSQGIFSKDLPSLMQACALLNQGAEHYQDTGYLSLLSMFSTSIAEIMLDQSQHLDKDYYKIEKHLQIADTAVTKWMIDTQRIDAIQRVSDVLRVKVKVYLELMPFVSEAQEKLQETYRRLEDHITFCEETIGAFALWESLLLMYLVSGERHQRLGDECSEPQASERYGDAKACYEKALSLLPVSAESDLRWAAHCCILRTRLGEMNVRMGKSVQEEPAFEDGRRQLLDAMKPMMSVSEQWQDFMSTATGEEVSFAYLESLRCQSKLLTEQYKKLNQQELGLKAKALLEDGLEWLESLPQFDSMLKIHPESWSLYMPIETLSWSMKDYDLGYTMNQRILDCCKFLKSRGKSYLLPMAEVKAQFNMSMQASHLNKDSAVINRHLVEAKQLAQGLISKKYPIPGGKGSLYHILYSCEFQLAQKKTDPDKRRKEIQQIHRVLLRTREKYPDARLDALCNEITVTLNCK